MPDQYCFGQIRRDADEAARSRDADAGSGVGLFRNPQLFMKPGDVVRCTVEKIGVLENRIVGE